MWSGGKWVYKETSKWLDVAGRVMTAEAIRRWTVDNWPKPEPPPPSVPTFFQLAGNKMLYQHPNQSWLSEPPKGYDYYGKRMY